MYKFIASIGILFLAGCSAPNISEKSIPSPHSSITIVSPNGQEVWKDGSSQTIRWTSDGSEATQPVEISLERKTPVDTQFWNIGTITTNQPGSGSYLWKVSAKDTTGNITAGSQYKILIGRNLAKGTGQVDESNHFFTINAEEASSPSVHLVGFEQAINSSNWVEAEKYLASKVYVVLEGSECCGEKSSNNAAKNLKSFKGIAFSFDENADVVKEYMANEKEQNPSGRKFGTTGTRKVVTDHNLVIGVENDPKQLHKVTIGYFVEDGKITFLFINPGRDR